MKISVMDKKDTAIAISLAKFKELKDNLLITELDDVMRLCEEALAQPAQKPVGKVYNGNAYWARKAPDNATPLYTALAQSTTGEYD